MYGIFKHYILQYVLYIVVCYKKKSFLNYQTYRTLKHSLYTPKCTIYTHKYFKCKLLDVCFFKQNILQNLTYICVHYKHKSFLKLPDIWYFQTSFPPIFQNVVYIVVCCTLKSFLNSQTYNVLHNIQHTLINLYTQKYLMYAFFK